MIVDRELLVALRRVITAAANPRGHASLEDLTTVQLAADDMQAALDAHDIWAGRRPEVTDAEVVGRVMSLVR